MHDPGSHPPFARSRATAARSLLRASTGQRLGIAIVLATGLWLAVFWALTEAAT
jgi:hypothetical protein